ncbi:type IV toxin-antitoxin system AbiEi family antitoxin domain-containing protein [Conexibacter sp. DBS9H8]|uniref:type IV toxin-antitoxin system AbiEi family antitoxin domain-containing protein n=1 Tax=Conexibacter sp. DBS9H8 TaxID=2937801 RepID=UPI0020107B05|nr:type IV toxin-antitoxin system AbiEi family antitoxin domain-containing protein [Conexibacter sp. DBS9H8]
MTECEFSSYRRICDLAAIQGGFVGRAQLTASGLSRTTIDSWRRCGRLQPAWTGVYAVGHLPTEPRARAFGALLAAGNGAALAGWSAAAFYGAVTRWPERFELVSPRRCRVRGLTVHHCRSLCLRDVWRFDGLRVTSPARTALDLAGEARRGQLKAIVDHLRLRHGLRLDQLRDVAARNPRRPGTQPLLVLIGESGPRPSRSALERGWRQFAQAWGIGPYQTNVPVAGHEVDVLIDGRVIVEIDTFGTHLLNFESDRERDAHILATTGIPTVRITDTALRGDPRQVAERIRLVIAHRRGTTSTPAPDRTTASEATASEATASEATAQSTGR